MRQSQMDGIVEQSLEIWASEFVLRSFFFLFIPLFATKETSVPRVHKVWASLLILHLKLKCHQKVNFSYSVQSYRSNYIDCV